MLLKPVNGILKEFEGFLGLFRISEGFARSALITDFFVFLKQSELWALGVCAERAAAVKDAMKKATTRLYHTVAEALLHLVGICTWIIVIKTSRGSHLCCRRLQWPKADKTFQNACPDIQDKKNYRAQILKRSNQTVITREPCSTQKMQHQIIY